MALLSAPPGPGLELNVLRQNENLAVSRTYRYAALHHHGGGRRPARRGRPWRHRGAGRSGEVVLELPERETRSPTLLAEFLAIRRPVFTPRPTIMMVATSSPVGGAPAGL